MASTVLVREVLGRASSLMQDLVPQFHRAPEREMVDALYDGEVAITKFLPAACSRIDAIKLAPGTRQSIETILAANCKPGNGSTPTQSVHGTQVLDVLRNMGTDGVTPGTAIRLTERSVMDSQSPNWHTATGPAIRSFMFDPRTPRYFYVTPGVPSGGLWIEAAFTSQPAKILNNGVTGAELYKFDGSDQTTIDVADEHVDDLVYYVVARMLQRQTEWADATKANYFAQMFLNNLNAKLAANIGNNPNLQQLPFAGEPIGRAK